MTKKHYEAIAAIIKSHIRYSYEGICDTETAQHIALCLADYFEQDNPRFERARFLAACGIEQKYCEQCMSTPCQQE